jgi:phosphonate transport system ATP-binding protein
MTPLPQVVPALQVRALTKAYSGVHALEDVSFAGAPGEFVALLGRSGAGKTTLFRCLTRLIRPDSGAVIVGGRALAQLHGRQLRGTRREIGLIFQQFNLIRRMTAIENVLAGRLGHVATWRVLLRRFRDADRQLALASLDRVELLPQAYQRADTLSGGQQQRVAIARVLAQQSRLVLADEPVASLDPQTAGSVLAMLRAVAHERQIAVVCSLHQVELALAFADRVIGLRAGRLRVDCPVALFEPAEHAAIYQNNDPTPQADQDGCTSTERHHADSIRSV